MDLTESIAPRSDQMNADDMVGGPLTVTIANVTAGTPEQPVNVELVEYPGRPYKPSKSMRRVLVAAWGKEASAYVGRRLTLFRNPDIKFGRETVGGIEIAAMSHLDKPLTVSLTVTRGKRKPFKVEPLREQSPTPTPDPQPAYDLDALDLDSLRNLYMDRKAAGATPEELNEIQAAAQRQESK